MIAVGVDSVSRDSRNSATASSAVPMIGNTLYLPRLLISCPLMIEVTSRPRTMGSRYTPEIVADTPRTTCRYSGRKASAPNIANPAANEMAADTENTRLRNSRGGRTGSAAWWADHHQAAVSTTAPTPRPMITPESHGYVVPPHEVRKTTQVAAPPSSTVPR